MICGLVYFDEHNAYFKASFLLAENPAVTICWLELLEEDILDFKCEFRTSKLGFNAYSLSH